MTIFMDNQTYYTAEDLTQLGINIDEANKIIEVYGTGALHKPYTPFINTGSLLNYLSPHHLQRHNISKTKLNKFKKDVMKCPKNL